jgi:hypothetical protein
MSDRFTFRSRNAGQLHLSFADTVDWVEVEGTELDPTSLPDASRNSAPEAVSGIRNLMIAVLEDAVRGYVAGDARERSEVEVWIRNRERRFPFSFTVICDTLGLEPDAVRQALRRMRRSVVPSRRAVIRARRNARRPSSIRVAKK